MSDLSLPKEVRQALNGLAHASGQMHAVSARLELQNEYNQLKAKGMTNGEILEHLFGKHNVSR